MDQELGKLARKQWGVFSRAQAIATGVKAWTIQRRIISGDWVEITSGVYRFRGGHSSWHQRVFASTLGIGGMASHRTAAFLWGLQGMGGAPGLLELIAPRNAGRHVLLAKVHQARLMPANPVLRDQIPTTPLARTLVDLSDVLKEKRLAIAFDSAWRSCKTMPADLEMELTVSGRGRRNRHRLLKLLDRAKGDRPNDSPLEAEAALAMDQFGIPRPTRQHKVYDSNGKYIVRADFAWLGQRVIVMLESRLWHLTPSAFETDLLHRRRLESNGWRMIHVTHQMLKTNDWLVDLGRLLTAQSPLALGTNA